MSFSNLYATDTEEQLPETVLERVRLLELTKQVDRLGRLKAKIADLQKEVAEIREQFISSGIEELDGKLFKVKVANYSQHQVDWKAIVSDLKAPQEIISYHTTLNKRQRLTVSTRG